MRLVTITLLLIGHLLVSPTHQLILVEETLRDHVPLAEAALHVTRRYISPKSNTLVIMENCKKCEKSRQNFQCRLLDYYLKHFNGLMSLQLFIGEADDQPWNYNIFIVDSMQSFNELRFHFPKTLHEREFYFLVILTFSRTGRLHRFVTMHDIFLSCLHFNVLNVVIMLESPDGSIVFYSHELFGRDCNLEIAIYFVNRFNNGKLLQDFLFPITRNLYKCTLNVSAHHLPPLLVFQGDRKNSKHLADYKRLSGIDGEILKLLAEALNFQIGLNFPEEKSFIDVKNNSTGCFAMLEKGIADIAIGGFSGSQQHRSFFTASVTYHQSPFVFVVRSDHHFGPIGQLVKAFHLDVWLTIGATLSLAILVILMIRVRNNPQLRIFVLGPNNRGPISNLLTIFLGNPINRLPQRNFARFLLMSWMLITLVLRNAYQGKMFDALRASRRIPIPRSIEELMERDYTLLASSYVDFYPRNRTVLLEGNFLLRYEFVDYASNFQLTTVSMLDNLAHYNRLHWSSRLTFVNEPIYQHQLVMYFRKHSILKFMFDHKIKQLMSSGIMSLVEKKFVKKKFQMMNLGVQRVPEISNKMLTGLYIIYIILICWSVMMFIIELASHRVGVLKRFCIWAHNTD